MNNLLIAMAAVTFSATSVFAQATTPAANPDGETPAVVTPAAPADGTTTTMTPAEGETPAVATPSETNPTAPVPGANSFTEAQARDRIIEAGYADVTELVLDTNGIWQAKATKGGTAMMVSMDYQGNIVAK